MMKRAAPMLCAAGLVIALASAAIAQTQTQPMSGDAAVKGTVVGPSNMPQAGIPVQIVGPPGKTVAITDKNGNWSVYNLPAGDYKVQALGADKTSNANQVTFSVKETPFWRKFTGSATEIVNSPQIKLEENLR